MRADESTFTLHNQHASGIRAGDQEYLFVGLCLQVPACFNRGWVTKEILRFLHYGGWGGNNNQL